LYELATVVLDNLGEPGDALVDIGPDLQAGQSSTVIGACLLQCAVLSGIEECLRRGIRPPVLVSNNIAGAATANRRLVADFPSRLPEVYERARRVTHRAGASGG